MIRQYDQCPSIQYGELFGFLACGWRSSSQVLLFTMIRSLISVVRLPYVFSLDFLSYARLPQQTCLTPKATI